MGNYINPSDITTWPSGTLEAEKISIISEKEQLIEKITNTHFYEKTFSIKMDGNGKNRLHIPITEDIISVTLIRLCGVTLDSDYFTYDKHSVYLDCSVSGAGVSDPELTYILTTTTLGQNLFPRGLNNVEVTGKYGLESVPEPIKKACKILIDEENVAGTYKKVQFKSERIGKYAYDKGTEGEIPILTGILEADIILKNYLDDGISILSP